MRIQLEAMKNEVKKREELLAEERKLRLQQEQQFQSRNPQDVWTPEQTETREFVLQWTNGPPLQRQTGPTLAHNLMQRTNQVVGWQVQFCWKYSLLLTSVIVFEKKESKHRCQIIIRSQTKVDRWNNNVNISGGLFEFTQGRKVAKVLALGSTSGTGWNESFWIFFCRNFNMRKFWLRQHQWHWLEGKLLNFFHGKLALRKFWRWAAPVALVRRKALEFFPWKTCPEEFLALGSTSATGWKESFWIFSCPWNTLLVEFLALGSTSSTGWAESFWIYFRGKLSLRKFRRWAAPVALLRSKVSEFFLRKF